MANVFKTLVHKGQACAVDKPCEAQFIPVELEKNYVEFELMTYDGDEPPSYTTHCRSVGKVWTECSDRVNPPLNALTAEMPKPERRGTQYGPRRNGAASLWLGDHLHGN